MSVDGGVDANGSTFSVADSEFHWSLVVSINDKSSWASDWILHTWSSWSGSGWLWWAWRDHVQVAVWSVGAATSSDGSVVPDGLAGIVNVQAVAHVCWDTGVDGDVGVSKVGSYGGAISLTVLLSSSVEDCIS